MNSSHLGIRLLIKYYKSPLWEIRVDNLLNEIKLIIKCMIKYKVNVEQYHYK